MSEDEPKNVEIKADQETESLGHSSYIGSLESIERRKRKASLAVMAVVVAGVGVSMLHTKKKADESRNERPPLSPNVSLSNQISLNPKLLTERDLVNQIPRSKPVASVQGKIQIVSLRSNQQLSIGSEINAVLASGATDGIVKARLNSPMIHDGEPILPSGTVLFGRGKSGEERLFVEFSKAILPSGESLPIRAQAFDLSDRIQGLKGAVVGRRTKKMAGAIAFGLMGGMAEGLQETGGSIYMPKRASTRDAALSGASKAALDQSKAYLDEMKNSPNIIEVKSGQEILVIVDEPKTKNEKE